MKKRNLSLSEKTSYGSIVVNVILSMIKMAAGILGHSMSLVSDAIHSLSDVLSTFLVLIGLAIASKSPDSDHEYGHERFECLTAILLSVFLALTGIAIGWKGLRDLFEGSDANVALPSALALYAALLSIVVKEAMFQITRKVAKKENSPSLMADAYHHRSDAFSSIGALIGVALARHGFPMGEPIASVIICLFILKASVEIFADAASKMTDKSCSKEKEEEMKASILKVDGVERIDSLKTRQFGAYAYVDVEIAVDGNLPLKAAHAIAEAAHDRIEGEYPEVKHCMVHENPF